MSDEKCLQISQKYTILKGLSKRTDVYSHILDDDRRNNARLFEEAFYSVAGKDPTKREPEPQPEAEPTESSSADTATLLKLLQNPEMAALLKTLAKSL